MRAVRNLIGISQMDLGEIAGIHFTNIAKIERGEANPSLFTIIRIASALEINPADLVTELHAEQVPESNYQLPAKDYVQDKLNKRREQKENPS